MNIPLYHQPITAKNLSVDLSHLGAFGLRIPQKGISGGDIHVEVRFSTHVYTERATHGLRRDIQDQSGTWRTFCPDRYAVSQQLPSIVSDFILEDRKATVSKDFNKGSNLLIVEAIDRTLWAMFFCFEPRASGLLLSILSLYAKTGNMHGHAKYNNASYYARKCLFSNKRVP